MEPSRPTEADRRDAAACAFERAKVAAPIVSSSGMTRETDDMTTTEPAAPALSRRDAQRLWAHDNPMRRWRKREKLTRADAAVACDASASSIQQWEIGGYYPNDESIDKIAGAIGIKSTTLARQWRAWYDARPGNTK